MIALEGPPAPSGEHIIDLSKLPPGWKPGAEFVTSAGPMVLLRVDLLAKLAYLSDPRRFRREADR